MAAEKRFLKLPLYAANEEEARHIYLNADMIVAIMEAKEVPGTSLVHTLMPYPPSGKELRPHHIDCDPAELLKGTGLGFRTLDESQSTFG